MYPEDMMFQTFGTATPSVADRAQYFRNLRISWGNRMYPRKIRWGATSNNHEYIGSSYAVNILKNVLKLRIMWDYQMSTHIYFANDIDLAQFTLLAAPR